MPKDDSFDQNTLTRHPVRVKATGETSQAGNCYKTSPFELFRCQTPGELTGPARRMFEPNSGLFGLCLPRIASRNHLICSPSDSPRHRANGKERAKARVLVSERRPKVTQVPGTPRAHSRFTRRSVIAQLGRMCIERNRD